MSLQAILDNYSLSFLPVIQAEIKKAKFFEANQMRCKTLRLMTSYKKPLIDMNEKEIKYVQENLIEIFKFKEWIK